MGPGLGLGGGPCRTCITVHKASGADKPRTPQNPAPTALNTVTSTQTGPRGHLEIHAPGAGDPVVEAQDDDTGHQGSQHERW